ncbi:MAG: NADPH-dependent glutamate synthase [Bacteroidetes bacterium]|nr:NADPH-dependent glutamate synthase [Bacteroidota bacterium]MCW5894784.1 NADPH-dependent glutamate synthase [Bacteroidota bacterium]
MKIPRQDSIEQEADARSRNFQEVSFGLNEERAAIEAQRCLECKNPVCQDACPVNIDIRGFIQLMLRKDYSGAVDKIREANYLPAICGRVCPQESQCEAECTLGKKHDPVAIGKLERFVADYEMLHNTFNAPFVSDRRKEKVAIVGSGPAGLTCAAELAKLGYNVTIFEALHALGGVLRYGIPEFRLPKEILDIEMERIKALGVEIYTNFLVGRTATIDEFFDEWGFSAIFLGTGAGTPTFMGIPGENLSGVYSANEFLTRVNLMGAFKFPDNDTPVKIGNQVAVIGGGNTAMDAVRTAKRLGAEKAYLVYRRSRQEMPAREEEIHHAEQEGIEFLLLTNPTRILSTEGNWVRGLECQRMELGEPDESGRRKPVAVAGSEFVLDVQTVIEAIGQKPNPIIQSTTPGLKTGKRGVVEVDEKQTTTRRGIFAGGDLSRGGATVILAMKDGKIAAAEIHNYLQSNHRPVSSQMTSLSTAQQS